MEIWGDMGRYGELWRGVERCGENLARRGEIWRGELLRDLGEVTAGDRVLRLEEDVSQPRLAERVVPA